MSKAQWNPTYFTGPNGYRCSTCTQRGVKLWRPMRHNRRPSLGVFSEFYDPFWLLCGMCVLRYSKVTCEIDEDGIFKTGGDFEDNVLPGIDMFFIPAIPTGMKGRRHHFWPHQAAHPEYLKWWKKLPTSADFYKASSA